MRRLFGTNLLAHFGLLFAVAGRVPAGQLPPPARHFIESHCVECHDTDSKKGGLDLTELKFDPSTSTNFSRWVLIHDRVSKGEMPPPKKKERPAPNEVETFTKSLSAALTSIERAQMAKEGRATRRRGTSHVKKKTI